MILAPSVPVELFRFMQLMHMVYCLYRASCSGVCRYSSVGGFSSFGIWRKVVVYTPLT